MNLPIYLLKDLDVFVGKLDEDDCYTDRQVAIRETARLLISLTHDEHYDVIDASSKKYRDITDACQHFMGM